MGNIGLPELMVILVVVLLIFGPSKLPQIGSSLGRGISEFKKGFREGNKPDPPQEASDSGQKKSGD